MKLHQLLVDKINNKKQLIEDWLSDKFSKNRPLFYNSVDLRCSGFKIAPIDTNCFPAGFNNLSDISKAKAKQIVSDFFAKNHPTARKIMILPESHTRNFKYLENVLTLKDIIAGDNQREVVVGSLIEELDDQFDINLSENRNITLHKIIKSQNKIVTKTGFVADLIIINNDFTNPVPQILNSITQPAIPPANLGWHYRRKSTHFEIYDQIAAEFSALIDIDPWLITAIDDLCEDINFKEKKGVECLAKNVDIIIAKIKDKYQQYQIKDQPYCYIKADKGTYGIAMMTATCGEQMLDMNKKQRNNMNMLKGNVQNTQIIIQEGIPTMDKVKNTNAEPMIYLINGKIAGNLFRINDKRDNQISLNADGMSFHDLTSLKDEELNLSLKRDDMIKIYEIIAKLAALAAAQESYE